MISKVTLQICFSDAAAGRESQSTFFRPFFPKFTSGRAAPPAPTSSSSALLGKKERGDIYPFDLPRQKKKKKTEQMKACVSRQDAQDAADNIDPWLPLKNFLCLTDFSSFGLYALRNESQVPVKMSTWGWSPHLLHTHTHERERPTLR